MPAGGPVSERQPSSEWLSWEDSSRSDMASGSSRAHLGLGIIPLSAYRLALILLPVLAIAPSLRLGTFAISPAYPLLFVLLPTFVAIMRWPVQLSMLAVLMAGIVLQVAMSSVVGSLAIYSGTGLPLDVVQYVALFSAFLIWFVACYNRLIDARFAVVVMLVTAVLAMTIGVLQWIPGDWNRVLWELYSYSDWQMVNFAAPLPLRRVPGVAHMATSNGGVAAAFFVMSLIVVTQVKGLRSVSLVIALLCVLNAIASQARMGLLTMVFACFVVFALAIRAEPRKAVRYTSALLLFCIVIAFAGYLIVTSDNALALQALYRWQLLAEQLESGGNRIQQMQRGLALLDGPYPALLGVSRAAQQALQQAYFEVEPLNILVLYGAVGAVLHYSLVSSLLYYLWRNLRRLTQTYDVVLASTAFAVLLGYQFFSLAYYFFRDTYVGALPWMMLGAAVGTIERSRQGSLVDRSAT
jgi:hypothetical protein